MFSRSEESSLDFCLLGEFLPTLMIQNFSLLLELRTSPALNLSANVLPGFRLSPR